MMAAMTSLTISCDDCAMQGTTACDDCVVTFLCGREPDDAVIIDADEERAVRLLGPFRPGARCCVTSLAGCG